MKALTVAVILTLALPSAVLAAAPLSPAETKVCGNLKQCISILKRHPQDSFDYSVLAQEFARYGSKGRKALIRMLRSGGPEAGHAADLIALSADETILSAIRKIEPKLKDTETPLVKRTIEALSLRITGTRKQLPAISEGASMSGATRLSDQPCQAGTRVDLGAEKREMPFFESKISYPDAYGAYQPSAEFRLALRRAERRDLRSAAAIPGGWLAGYAGGLVHYDANSGKPTILSRAPILSLQRREAGTLDQSIWVMSYAQDTIIISSADSDAMRSLLVLKGPLGDLRRSEDGTLHIISGTDRAVRLRPDGTYLSGCTS